jgi:hypothetical protein
MMAKLILSIIYCAGTIFTVVFGYGDRFAFPVVYRIIYAPVAFWGLTCIYAYLFARLDSRNVNIPRMLLLGIPLHLYLVLSNAFFTVAVKAPEIAVPYKLYIALVLCGFVFGMSLWGGRALRASDVFFSPALFAFAYPAFLASRSGDYRMLGVFMLLAACAMIIGKDKHYYAVKAGVSALIRFFASERRRIVFIFVMALCLRVAFGLNIVSKTGLAFPTASDDGRTYDMMSERLSIDALYLRNPEFTPSGFEPGYSFFLGLIYKIFGRSFYMATIIQSIIGSIVPVLVYLLANVIIDRRVALVGALWASLDQGLIMMSCVLGQESLYIPLLMFAIYIITTYVASSDSRMDIIRSFAAGIALGFAAVVRSVIVYFIPVIVSFIFFLKNDKAFWARTRNAMLILVFACGSIAPLTYLNYLNSGKYYLLTQPKPITQWESDEGYGYYFPGNAALARMGVNPFKDMRGSIKSIAREPVKFVSILSDLLPRRTVAFFFAYNFGFFDPVYLINAAKLANRFASNLEFYIALAVLYGFVLIVRNAHWRRKAWPMILVILYYAFVHVVICRMGNIRYRAPIHPYLIIFGALGIITVSDYIRKGLAKGSNG